MSLSIGIIGLPNVGKSTLFNALLRQRLAKVDKYPFTTKDKNVGVVEVPDPNLEKLAEIVATPQSEVRPQILPASIKFVDIAGLVKGAHKGEGLGNEFLGYIREVNVVCHVVRVFTDLNVPHVMGEVDPKRDVEVVRTELILKDLETLEGAKIKGKKEKVWEKIIQGLDSGKMVKELNLTTNEEIMVQDFSLLTAKKMVYFLNSDEEKIIKLGGSQKEMEFLGSPAIWACAKLEEDLAELPHKEQEEYLSSLGIKTTGVNLLIRECFRLLDLINFYTIAGGKIVQVWPIKKGATALKAAAQVHSDMASGFIKAEVVSFEDLIQRGSWKKTREEGKMRIEGREYVIKDEDVVEFKFKV